MDFVIIFNGFYYNFIIILSKFSFQLLNVDKYALDI